MNTLDGITLDTLHQEAKRARALAEKCLVLLTQRAFDALLEYSHSIPTGTRIGKQWKSRKRSSPPGSKDPEHFVACEYVPCPDGPTCPARWQYARDGGEHVHITYGQIEIVEDQNR